MALTVSNLSFERNEQMLFDKVHFELFPGEILQIKGANGAGKTSLLRILCGLLPVSTGNIYWKKSDIHIEREAYLQDLIYIGHQLGIKNGLTSRENLRLWSALQKHPLKMTAEQTLAIAGLTYYENTLAQHLSAGQKQRLALARLSLLSAPIWILDEPFTALDAEGVAWVTTLLHQHLAEQGIVIMTSHQLVHLNEITVKELQLI